MTSTYTDVYFKTSIKDGTGNPADPPEDVYAQLITLIKSGILKGDDGLTPYVGSNNNWWIGDIDTGVLARGTDGEDGYTPVKGVDYFTEEEIQQIQNEVSGGAIGDFKAVVDEKTATFNTNAENTLTGYNANAQEKFDTYNANANSKFSDYNTNAEEKFSKYTSNAEAKLSEYNQNDSDKTALYNANAESRFGAYDSNAQDKLDLYNQNDSEKTEAYNNNAQTKLDTYIENADNRLSEYNENADNRDAEFNSQTEQIQSQIDNKFEAYNTNAETKFSEYNSNAESKVAAYNQNDSKKTEAYNANAAEKLTAYDTNAEQHTTDYNRNAEQKMEAYNSNHTEKVAEYNQNAETKTAEFDANAAALQTEVDRLRGECDTLAAENRKQENRISALMKLNKGQTYDILPEEGETASRTAPSGSKYVSVDKVGGKSVVWNQLFNVHETKTSDGLQIVSDGQTITMSGNSGSNKWMSVLPEIGEFTALNARNHLYLYSIFVVENSSTEEIDFGLLNRNNFSATIPANYTGKVNFVNTVTNPDAGMSIGFARLQANTDYNVRIVVSAYDLTLMFGAGNEPTAEQFERMFPANYYPYSEPTIISSQTDRVDVKSSNLIYPNMPFIDRSGYTSSGVTYTYDENRVITINGTRAENVSGSLGLFYYSALDNGKYTLSVYDEYGNYASDVNINVNVIPPYTFVVADSNRNSIITIAASISGKKYNNTKYYIKLEKGAKSTPYNPHIMQQITTNFPVLNSAGSAYDYIDIDNGKLHQRVGVVDLGTLDWVKDDRFAVTRWKSPSVNGIVKHKTGDYCSFILCSKYEASNIPITSSNKDKCIASYDKRIYITDSAYTDATAFKEAMSGVMLYYELADEVITDIEIPTELTDWLPVEAGGTVAFRNADESKQLPVPNAVRWVRKLDEVN